MLILSILTVLHSYSKVAFEGKHLTVGSIAVGSIMQFTVKLKNTGLCAAVFRTDSTDNLSTDIGTGVGVEQDLELIFNPQRVSERVRHNKTLLGSIFRRIIVS